MPVVEDQVSQSSSSDDGYYYRKSKPFVKNPSKIFVGGLPYSTSDGLFIILIYFILYICLDFLGFVIIIALSFMILPVIVF